LIAQGTNAPFLVQEDGFFLWLDSREQVWDLKTNAPQPPDAPGAVPALECEFTVGGRKVKPAFQLFREHVARYTPKWAAEVCRVPVEQIRRIARELGEEAHIGSMIVVDGAVVPYRPVAIHAYHMAQQELDFQAIRAMITVMLLGAVWAAGASGSTWGRGSCTRTSRS